MSEFSFFRPGLSPAPSNSFVFAPADLTSSLYTSLPPLVNNINDPPSSPPGFFSPTSPKAHEESEEEILDCSDRFVPSSLPPPPIVLLNYNTEEVHPPRTRLSIDPISKRIHLEWPDARNLRQIELVPDGLLVPPLSYSPLITYQPLVSSREGKTVLRLIPIGNARLNVEPITVNRIAGIANRICNPAEANMIISIVKTYFQPTTTSINDFDRSLTTLELQTFFDLQTNNNNAILQRYINYVLDWVRWRTLEIESDVIFLARFIDDIHTLLHDHESSKFHLFVPYLAKDLRQGDNILAHHVTGLLSLDDIRRWAAVSTRAMVAPLQLEENMRLWEVARKIFVVWKQVYDERGPYLDAPVNPEQEPQYKFFQQQRVLFQPPSLICDPSDKRLMLGISHWHEKLITNLLGRLEELSDTSCMPFLSPQQQQNREPIDLIKSTTDLINEKLTHTELVVLNHPFEAAEAIVSDLCAIATWTIAPGERLPPNFESITVPERLPNLVVVRQLHFWTIGDLADLLATLYIRPAKVTFYKLFIEGDFRCSSRVCQLVQRATMYHLGLLTRPLWGIYNNLRPNLFGVIRQLIVNNHDRLAVTESILNTIKEGRRPSEVFEKLLKRKRTEPSPLRWIQPGSNFSVEGMYIFQSMPELLRFRRTLPLATQIYVPLGRIQSFEELYFLFRATSTLLVLEANCIENLLTILN